MFRAHGTEIGDDVGPLPVDVALDVKARMQIASEHERRRQGCDVPVFRSGAAFVEEDREGWGRIAEEPPNTNGHFRDTHGENGDVRFSDKQFL